MRRVKKLSIARYISVRFTGIVFIMAALLVLFVTYFSNRVIEMEIKEQVKMETRYDYTNIKYAHNQIVVSDEFVYEENGVTKIILTEDGKIISGEYPDADLIKYEVIKRVVRKVRSKNGIYYIYDRPIIKQVESGENKIIAVVRSVGKKSELSLRYRMPRYASYISSAAVVIIVILIAQAMSRQIMEPLKLIYETSEKIGKEKDLSQRVKYDGIFEEIDTLVQANNRMLDRLEDMFEKQKQFTSDVAHELRTPVAVIMSECQYAKKHIDNKEEFDEAIETIERQVKKTNQIITQLLYLSRMDQDRIKINFEYVDLKDIAEPVCENEQLKDTKNVEIKIKLYHVKAQVDIGLMTVVMSNLVNNAVKYSHENSIVKVYLRQSEENVIFQVRDYGIGMNEEEQKHIFDRFYRVDKARNSEGFGLGLSIVMKIIEIHNGNIIVKSQEGKGTLFTVTFPKIQRSLEIEAKE